MESTAAWQKCAPFRPLTQPRPSPKTGRSSERPATAITGWLFEALTYVRDGVILRHSENQSSRSPRRAKASVHATRCPIWISAHFANGPKKFAVERAKSALRLEQAVAGASEVGFHQSARRLGIAIGDRIVDSSVLDEDVLQAITGAAQ